MLGLLGSMRGRPLGLLGPLGLQGFSGLLRAPGQRRPPGLLGLLRLLRPLSRLGALLGALLGAY